MFSMSDVAAATGVASYRIKYALETGALDESKRLAGRRCFTLEDVERVRKYFATEGRAGRDQGTSGGGDAS
jgi:DNA-binding transcriptional MerR regulator